MASARPPHDDLRQAAFARLRLLERVYGEDISWKAIERGFECNGEKVLLVSKPVGIFKPKQMSRGALSIRTSKPRPGRQNIYADAEGADGTFVYSLQGDDPDNHFNRSLRECMEDRLPLVHSMPFPKASKRRSFPALSRASRFRMVSKELISRRNR